MGKPLAESVDKKLFGKIRQLKGSGQPLLRRHFAERLDIKFVIGTWFYRHLLFVSAFVCDDLVH